MCGAGGAVDPPHPPPLRPRPGRGTVAGCRGRHGAGDGLSHNPAGPAAHIGTDLSGQSDWPQPAAKAVPCPHRRRRYGVFLRDENPSCAADDPGGGAELHTDCGAAGIPVPPLLLTPLPPGHRHVPQRVCPQRENALGTQRRISGRSYK